MSVERYSDAAAFLARAEPFLLETEVENNLILGLTLALAKGPPPQSSRSFFAAVLDRGRVVLCGFQTLSGKLGVTRAASAVAVDELVADVARHGPTVQVVMGPAATAEAVAQGLAARLGLRVRRHGRQRLHQLDRVVPIARRASGVLRSARQDEQDWLREWVEAFMADIEEQGDLRAQAVARVRSDALFVWDDNGAVSMASVTGRTPNGARVALVYTPPPLRGRGYASACVEALSARLLDEGNKYCCLYTDLANPTSNAIYARLGYVPVCDMGVLLVE